MATSLGPSKRSLSSTLTDLYQSRGLLLGLLATLIGLIFIIITPASAQQLQQDSAGKLFLIESDSVLLRLHIDDIGSALFQAGLTIALFQVLLNRIAEDRFAERVDLSLGEHEKTIRLAVGKSLAVSDSINHLQLSPEELEKVIVNAVRLRTKNSELGIVIGRKLRSGVFEARETWRNLTVRADIFALEQKAISGKQFDYYDVYYQFGYHTTNTSRSRFALKVARWRDEYDKYLRDEELGAVWRLPSTGEFDDDWQAGFTLVDVSYGGVHLDFQVNEVEREYITHLPVEDVHDRDDILVQYTFNAKILCDGNLMSFEVPRPTFSATYSISIGVNDIERVRAFDYFGLTRPASIGYSPTLNNVRNISISVDDWILPKAGALIVWKRKPSAST